MPMLEPQIKMSLRDAFYAEKEKYVSTVPILVCFLAGRIKYNSFYGG